MESLEDKSSQSNLLLLLQLIYAGADVDALLNRGLQYTQIAELIFKAKKNDLVTESETKLELTPLGFEKIKNNKTLANVKGSWISPLDEFRTEPIPIDEVYLPSWRTKDNIERFNFKAKLLASGGKPQE